MWGWKHLPHLTHQTLRCEIRCMWRGAFCELCSLSENGTQAGMVTPVYFLVHPFFGFSCYSFYPSLNQYDLVSHSWMHWLAGKGWLDVCVLFRSGWCWSCHLSPDGMNTSLSCGHFHLHSASLSFGCLTEDISFYQAQCCILGEQLWMDIELPLWVGQGVKFNTVLWLGSDTSADFGDECLLSQLCSEYAGGWVRGAHTTFSSLGVECTGLLWSKQWICCLNMAPGRFWSVYIFDGGHIYAFPLFCFVFIKAWPVVLGPQN